MRIGTFAFLFVHIKSGNDSYVSVWIHNPLLFFNLLIEDVPDPLVRSIHAILDQLHRVDEKMHTIGEHLGQVNPKYSDEELPTLDEKELMGELGPPEGASGKTG